jgi:hypothetical protein
MQVRVSSRVLDYLSGSQAWQDEQHGKPEDFRELSERSLMRRLQGAKRRKDGSVTVELSYGERDALWHYTTTLEMLAEQNLPDPDALAELNAACALIRRLAAA